MSGHGLMLPLVAGYRRRLRGELLDLFRSGSSGLAFGNCFSMSSSWCSILAWTRLQAPVSEVFSLVLRRMMQQVIEEHVKLSSWVLARLHILRLRCAQPEKPSSTSTACAVMVGQQGPDALRRQCSSVPELKTL